MSTNKFTTNNNPTLVAVSNVDGETPVYLYADPTTHGLVISGSISVDTTGLATSVKQDTGNTSLASIDNKLPALSGGSIPVTVTNAEPADVTGTFTNGTQTTSITTSSSLDGYEAVTVSINGTFTTATAIFEGSDDGGTTWYSLQGARTDSGAVETGYTTVTNASGAYRMWTIQVTGLDSFRLRSTAVASGTVNVRLSVSSAPTADASVVSIGSSIPAGAAIIGALTANQSVNVAQINGVTPLMGNGASGTGAQRVTIASDSTANIATIGTSITPGTGATNLGKAEDAAHVSGDTGVFALAVRNDSASALAGTSGDYIPITTGVNGETWVGLATKLAGEDQTNDLMKTGLFPTGTVLNTYSVHVTTNTTNTPTSSTAYISSIAISTEVAGTTSTVTIQDKQGTPLKLINALTTVAASTAPQIYNFQTPIKMTSGIDVITAGAVASTIDVWINYFV